MGETKAVLNCREGNPTFSLSSEALLLEKTNSETLFPDHAAPKDV